MAAEILTGGCVLLFVAAALGKLDSWRQWARLTAELPGPAGLGRIARVVLPAVEGAIAVIAVADPTDGLACAAVMLAGLAGGVWLLAGRLAGRECNCFGAVAPGTISRGLALRNGGLALLAGVGWYLAQRDHLRAMSPAAVAVTLLVGAIALMLVQAIRLRAAASAQRPARRGAQ